MTLADRTVLIIEDHKDSRDLLTTVLRSLRAHVVAVANIEQAERQLQFARPDLIVCDLKLPDGTGLDFIRWLRQQRRGRSVPAMAITGWGEHFPETLADGFDAYMQKPIDLDKFCTTAVSLGQR
jgi:two-component system, NtrC family, response regulator PilR